MEEVNVKNRNIFKAVLDLGMKRGTLTYDEINDALPTEFYSLEELENFMDILDKKGVKVVEYDKRLN